MNSNRLTLVKISQNIWSWRTVSGDICMWHSSKRTLIVANMTFWEVVFPLSCYLCFGHDSRRTIFVIGTCFQCRQHCHILVIHPWNCLENIEWIPFNFHSYPRDERNYTLPNIFALGLWSCVCVLWNHDSARGWEKVAIVCLLWWAM